MSVFSALTDIANAIREKTGKTSGMTLEQMAGEIASIQGGGGGGERGTFSYVSDIYAVHSQIVTVGENTCGNTTSCVDYLAALIPGTLIGAYLLSPYGDLNNQFICFEGGGHGTPKAFRFRNGAIGSCNVAVSYDGLLKPGTQYFLISDVLPS